VDPSGALWIGGGQGSGKTSVAWALSRRFDLQLYIVDRRVWVHEARRVPDEFASLSLDERWLHATTEQMLEWFVDVSRSRMELVLEDLAELPSSPLVIVEGPQLFPSFVAPLLAAPDQALFLVSPLAEQRERLLAREGILGTSDPRRAREHATERDLLITQRFADEARGLGLTTFEVDRPLQPMIERAAEHFAPAISRGPRGGDLAAVRRFENEVDATQVRLYRESLGEHASEGTPIPFACECGAPGCDAVVELPVEEYRAPVLAHPR